ncbi:MAG TPA: hypothetical protein VL576_02750 [Candidatus Paceibacterota bacterium]|jgi:hypothetical protein|nr:hypothetical protein [Candidatus Paceibacterota bacterium]
MEKNRKVTLKTDNEVIIKRLQKEGRATHLSDEVSAGILNGVREEMEGFNDQHIINQFRSEQEAGAMILY